MKTMKTLALAAIIAVGFAACADDGQDDKLIEVDKKDRLIERDRDKTEIDVQADDGQLDVGVDNDKSKVDVEIGEEDK